MNDNKNKFDKYQGMSFDDAIKTLEGYLDVLEKKEDSKLFVEATNLKDYCEFLLKKEKEEIIKIAQENNLSLEELGINE